MFIRRYKGFLIFTSQKIDEFLKTIAIQLLAAYKLIFSGYMGWSCRFYPTCSVYAMGCYKKYSFIKATYFTFKRLIRCRPLSNACGFDPVPDELNNSSCSSHVYKKSIVLLKGEQ